MTLITKNTVKKRADAKQYIRDYWSDRADQFAKLREQELNSNKYQRWEQELLRHLPGDRKLRILDAGCGSGFFSIILARLGHQVVGIDIAPEMIIKAKALAQTEQLSGEFHVMDVEHPEFPEQSFDAVISRNLTWNLVSPQTAYQEWFRMLKPGGVLLNYDGEHAKKHHQQSQQETGAHKDIPDELLERCHQIYHMLDISLANRPDWDVKLLEQIDHCSCEVDPDVGERIYQEKDIFYLPVQLFLVKAKKGYQHKENE